MSLRLSASLTFLVAGMRLACLFSDHLSETSMLLRALSLPLALTILTLLAPAAEAQTPLPLVDTGKLTWGMAPTFPPFESMQDGKLVGFDVDMVAAMADKMKVQSAPSTIEFKGLIPAILGNRIDTIVSGMYINDERKQVVDFIAYLRIGNQLLVAKGNPTHIKDTDDLCGHRIVVPVGTIYEKEAQAKAAECQSSGKPALNVMSLTSTAVGALSIKEGRADVLIASTPTDAALIKESPDSFETTGPTFENNTLLGIGISKEKPALRDALDAAFKAITADGTMADLIKKYGLPTDSAL
jgi:polar amino acid transport system substrate-binding protein